MVDEYGVDIGTPDLSMVALTGAYDASLATGGDSYNSTGPLNTPDSTPVTDPLTQDPSVGGISWATMLAPAKGTAYGANAFSTGVNDTPAGFSTPTNPTPAPSSGVLFSDMTSFFSKMNPFTSTALKTASPDSNVSQLNSGLQTMLNMFGIQKPALKAYAGYSVAKSKGGASLAGYSLDQISSIFGGGQARKQQAQANYTPILIGAGLIVALILFMRRG
jgi:hypothetical protein